MFWDLSCEPAYEVPAGSGKNSAFASSIWMGGLDESGGLHTAAQTYRQTGSDFFTGPYRTTGQYQDGITYNPSFPIRQILTLTNGNIVFAGDTLVELFNPANGTTITYMNPGQFPKGQVIELANGDILLYGTGLPFNSDPLIILDGTTFVGTQSISLNNNVWGYSATLLPNGEVLFCGFNDCTRFDPVAQLEIGTASMGQGRYGATTKVRPDGKVFVSGGGTSTGAGQLLSSTEIYDPATNTWAAGPALSIGRRGHDLLELPSGEWLLVGGNLNATTLDTYDPSTNIMAVSPGPATQFTDAVIGLASNGDVVISAPDFNCSRSSLFSFTPGQTPIQEGNTVGTSGTGTLLANGNLFVQQGNVFKEIDINTKQHVNQPWEKIWKVTQAEIDQFRSDFAQGMVNFANYPDIQTWPAHGNTSLGEAADQAPFVDVDADMIYDPLNSGDYPCIKGDQALWWTFNDDAAPHTETGGDKFGIQVKTMAYAYDCDTACASPWLDHTTFYQHQITNHSNTRYVDVYLGFWMDVDIGNFSDDYVGCDTMLGLGFAYNGDPDDETAAGYGLNPPAIGTMFLETPGGGGMTNFMHYENDFSNNGNPELPEHYYNYMRSIWKDGTPLVNNGMGGYPGNGSGPQTNYAFPGDAGFCGGTANGWSEVTANRTPFDRRYLQSYGPFTMDPGAVLTFETAVIWARSFTNDNLGSVCELKAAADSLPGWFEQQEACNPSVVSRAEPILQGEVKLYPNPTRDQATLEFSEPLRQDLHLMVMDQLGRRVQVQNLPAGTRVAGISTQGLADGVYLVRIGSGESAFARKLVVRH